MFHHDFFICQLSYFTRKYRPTVSASSFVHVCAPHNFLEKWYMHTEWAKSKYIVIYNIITAYLLLAYPVYIYIYLYIYIYTHTHTHTP